MKRREWTTEHDGLTLYYISEDFSTPESNALYAENMEKLIAALKTESANKSDKADDKSS